MQLGEKPERASLPVGQSPSTSVFIDISAVHLGRTKGGIARVSLEIASCLERFGGLGETVVLNDGDLRTRKNDGSIGKKISLGPTDVYLILDTFWEPREEYLASVKAAKAAGARTAICVHDVLPFDYPGLLHFAYVKTFEESLLALLPFVDCIVTVSRTSARRVRNHVSRRGFRTEVVWFHNGSDGLGLPAEQPADAPSPCPNFLSVGTIEPKKGYRYAIEAFEKIWSTGLVATYTIVGQQGWLSKDLMARIHDETVHCGRLIWEENANDARLRSLMQSSHCLIQASVAEGFGIPLVEAARYGLPIIASDIAVFREIAGPDAQYFVSGSSASLAEQIERSLETRPSASQFKTSTWAESTKQLLNAVLRGTETRASDIPRKPLAFNPEQVRLGDATPSLRPLPSIKRDVSAETAQPIWAPDGSGDFVWGRQIERAPPIFLSIVGIGFPLGAASAAGPMLKDRPAHFLCMLSWTIEQGQSRTLAEQARSYLAAHPRHTITFLCNAEREVELLQRYDLHSLLINHNCLVTETIFKPMPDTDPVYDAIYNARLAPEKRIELAREIHDLVLVYFYNGYLEDSVQAFHAEHKRLSASMPRARFVNALTADGCERLPKHTINGLLAQSRVGLCLSAAEGGMFASVEYLLAGLPIVSTPSLGGRDVFFDDEFCIICDPDPRRIREAVDVLVGRNIPRDYIRAKTLARVEAHRQALIDLVQDLTDRSGGTTVCESYIRQLIRDEDMLPYRPSKEFFKSIDTA